MSKSQLSDYEQAFGSYVGAFGARSFLLGRHALVILLKTLGINDGDKVGVCSYTCLSVVESVKVCGAIPVYLDVDDYLCIEPREILRQKHGSLKVVILQHTFGVPGQLEQLISACKKIGAKVVEDCSHSLGCFWKGEPLGKFGEGAIYSFQWGKPYTTGQGGMLTINSKKLLDEVDCHIEEWALPASAISDSILECERRLYSIIPESKLKGHLQYMSKKLYTINFFKHGNRFDLYRGYVRLASEMTAKVGLKQLANWPKLKRLRGENTEMIEEYLRKADLPYWPKPVKANVTMLRYPLLTRHKSRILKHANKKNLDIAGWYMSPGHPVQGDDLTKINYFRGSCPKAERMFQQLVHLPTGLTLDKKTLKAMMRIILYH